jgi:N-acetylneuraminic acid mutarotase
MWNQAAIYRRRRRTFAGAVAIFLLLLIIAVGTGGNGPITRLPPAKTKSSAPTKSPVPLTYAAGTPLIAPIRDTAAALNPDGTSFTLAGGLATADALSGGLATVTPTGVTLVDELPVLLDDAAAAPLGGDIYVFGGRSAAGAQNQIYQYSPAATTVTPAGSLPSGNYGLGAVTIGSTIYLVGGFDGHKTLDTILAWKPNGTATVVGTLPQALRYAAVATLGGEVVIAGGLDANSIATNAVYVFDPTSGKLRLLLHLPTALEGASAVTFGNLVYIIGGATAPTGTELNTIYSLDLTSHVASTAGTLPAGVSEASAVLVGSTIYIAGGLGPTGTTGALGTLTAASSALG